MASNKQKQSRKTQTAQATCKPQKILVPIDFSENSKQALPYAEEYARQFGAKVYLIHVVEPAPFISDLQDVPLALSDKQVAITAQHDLEALAAKEFPSSTAVNEVVRIGKAYNEIVAAAEELGIDLIITATHGYTGLKHTLLGSTAERVVRHAPCPVLVVR